MKKVAGLFIIFMFSINIIAQEKIQIDSIYTKNTIENQFNSILEKSRNWESFKIVPKNDIEKLGRDINDSLSRYKKDIVEKNRIISETQNKLSKTEEDYQLIKNELGQIKNEYNLFGMQISKDAYSAIMWAIIGVLSILLGVFIYKYINANKVTVSTVMEMDELSKEFEEFRAKSLEREQKIRRQLQDEINKHKTT